MLGPQQFGILAQLVHDALAKFPCLPNTGEKIAKILAHPEAPTPVEPWEAYLISEISRIDELPSYNDMYDEVDFLVSYYGDSEPCPSVSPSLG